MRKVAPSLPDLFDNSITYLNKNVDKIATFNGNVLISLSGTQPGLTDTICFRRTVKPEDRKIGDADPNEVESNKIPGYGFQFLDVRSVDVLIEQLQEVKGSMLEYADMQDALKDLEPGHA